MTPSHKQSTVSAKRSVLTTLVLLQDLELMIRDADDPAQTKEATRLGFNFEGLPGLRSARDELAGSLEPRVLKIYRVAASRYAGRAVVPVKDRICLGCSAMQPTGFEAAAHRIVSCQSCGRILYPL